MLDRLASLPGVTGYARDGGAAVVTVDDLASVPDLVEALAASGARLTKVTPHEPTLEELYFAVRNACAAPSAPGTGSRFAGANAALRTAPARSGVASLMADAPAPARSLTWTIARMDLRQLWQSPDFLVPMVVLAALFFVFLPAVLLSVITHVHGSSLIAKVSNTLDLLPKSVNAQIAARSPHATPAVRSSYALAVYLFAPLAVIVPMTISTAIGANCLVGEREKGTGEFLAHSPASEREIYTGKLIASLLPGYVTSVVGFGVYSLVVNLIVGPHVGGWFFPTRNWWILMFWVVPPFLAITLSVVLRLSARVKSAAAAQQASGLVTLPLVVVSFGVASGDLFGAGDSAFWVGLLAWLLAAYGLLRGARAVTRARLLGVD